MNHDLPRWPRIAVAVAAVAGLALGVTGTAIVIGTADGEDGPTDGVGAHGVSLVSYDTCDTALRELQNRVLPHVGPYGLDGGGYAMDEGGAGAAAEGDTADGRAAAPGAAPDAEAPVAGEAAPQAEPDQQSKEHSSTNVHESGVDEPDLVKTDGNRVVSITDGMLRIVDVASRKETAKVEVPGGYASQLLVSGDRALVTTEGGVATDRPVRPAPGGAIAEPSTPIPDGTGYGAQLVLIDLTGAGKVLGTLAVDGAYLDARQIGSVARVVVSSAPRLEFRYPDGNESPASLRAKNRAVVTSSSISDWLPRYQLSRGGVTTSGQLVDCASVSHPENYTGTAMLTVLTVDLQKELGVGDPVSIVADGNTVYGTGNNLYVADDHMASGIAGFAPGPGGAARTEVYQFDISGPGKPVHVASGAVEGHLLNQYSLSEHAGNLRVATTAGDQRGTQSMITVLTREGDELVQVGKVDGLGVGERIYAVRFFGETGYVVTFRETDPLYTVDLSNPAAPTVTGELKITGYSAYLHPAGEGRLIGVGQEATTEGARTGAQVSLFDTTNKAGARRVAQYHLANAMSEVESDPHAFLYWPDKGLVVLPVSGGGGAIAEGERPIAPAGGALVLRLSGDSFTEVGLLRHVPERHGGELAPRRALVIGAELWTVSEAGMLVSDLDSLAQQAWIPFV